MSILVEVEGGEFAVRNSAGDIAIIPEKYRREVEDMIAEKCYTCLDKLVASLPKFDSPEITELTSHELYIFKLLTRQGKNFSFMKQILSGDKEVLDSLVVQESDGFLVFPTLIKAAKGTRKVSLTEGLKHALKVNEYLLFPDADLAKKYINVGLSPENIATYAL